MRERYEVRGARASEIAASVEAAIAAGNLEPGARLPPVRALAARLRLSPATVAAAYRALRDRGLVAGDGRRGTRVAHRPPVPARTTGVVPAHLRNLADGNPDPRLLPALVVPRPARPRLYGEGVDLPELLAVARRELAAEGVEGELAVTGGGLDAVERVLSAWLRSGDRVGVEDPGFTGVHDLVAALGLVAVPIEVDESGPLPAAVERALRSGATALIVTPRAQNPTGAAIDAKRAADLRERLAGWPSVLVVEDDHAGPVAGAPLRTLVAGRERFAFVRSVSKWLGPDLRCAVVAADPTTASRVTGRLQLGAGWVSHLLQATVARLWADPSSPARFARAAAQYAERREALVAALAEHGIGALGRSGMNVWIPVGEETSVVSALAAAGWAVRAGEPYRRQAPPAIRVTVATLAPADARRLAGDLAAALRPSRTTATT